MGFVTWRSACKSTHGSRLRAQKCGCSLWKTESRNLFFYYAAKRRTLSMNSIAENYITVRHKKFHIVNVFAALSKCENTAIGIHVDFALFRVAEKIGFLLLNFHTVSDWHIFGVIAVIEHKTKWRIFNKHLTAERNIIRRCSSIIRNGYNNLTVRTFHLFFNSTGSQRHRRKQQTVNNFFHWNLFFK